MTTAAVSLTEPQLADLGHALELCRLRRGAGVHVQCARCGGRGAARDFDPHGEALYAVSAVLGRPCGADPVVAAQRGSVFGRDGTQWVRMASGGWRRAGSYGMAPSDYVPPPS